MHRRHYLVRLEPVCDLSETVLRLIEAFVNRLSFNQQSVRVDVSVVVLGGYSGPVAVISVIICQRYQNIYL